MKQTLIFDFDSTFIQAEAMEELVAISLQGSPDFSRVQEEVHRLTRLGMEGKMDYPEALGKRLKLLKADRSHLKELILRLQGLISPSILRNRKFFRKNSKKIIIISGGFKEFIDPIVEPFGIPSSQVFANRFHFDFDGQIVGHDENNPLAQTGGKPKLVRQLDLKGPVTVIGDGYTDYEIRKEGLADCFVAFTENVSRPDVIKLADFVAADLEDCFEKAQIKSTHSSPSACRALLLENIHPEAATALRRAGYEVELLSGALEGETLKAKLQKVQLLGIRSKTQVSKEILAAAPQLESIGAFCIGLNQVDLHEATELGIPVFNAPYSNSRSVVELALGLIVMLERKIFEKSCKLRQGVWDKTLDHAVEVRGKALGILGYGNIGTQLSVLAEAFGMKVYFYDLEERLPLGNAICCSSMEELFANSDVISLHVDGRESNHQLIGEKELELMRKEVILLNLSRGHVVDLEALEAALESGQVRGAAVDVYPEEPKASGPGFSSPLQRFPNVILTPHIGGNTVEAQRDIAHFVTRKLESYMETGSTGGSANFPNITLPALQNTHRILHIHRNIPGVLAKISSTLAEHSMNIEGQYLKTNEKIGYVITDVNATTTPELIQSLKAIPGTIKVKVLY